MMKQVYRLHKNIQNIIYTDKSKSALHQGDEDIWT